ncbi:hypothetical protein [Paenibacillus polymyxa]|uniref:Uncharacterized protein n=1 Tax=Paenibacillus polymyxa TaxID=1406 RepID=A0A378XZI7_PAEPO|nr:hypothetical protein [Paenibacillus polymyxa]MBE7896166.1 hypothetical protein [Paenibacillus polymyxa]MBG9765889.1 hypothetical protein [Paenibacillus polymyxa]MCC3256695.1 hypothetical protein [Paenibacillus polymyxa]UOD84508.1 hypothetical protein CUU60_04545 [Paenibacillus polymyxa ATCC 842]WEK65609.1 hypothetical protein ERJ71_14945 [Paenibacillus polymyxa]
MDIIDAIQRIVNEVVENEYRHDECPPEFIVSLLYEKSVELDERSDKDHKIILTVRHLGSCFSKVIFPQVTQVFGYDSLKEEMKYMYNRTM